MSTTEKKTVTKPITEKTEGKPAAKAVKPPVKVETKPATKVETKPPKKMTQEERDAIFGKDEPTVVVPKAGKKPAAKAEAKSEAKPATKSEDGEKVHGRISATNSRKLKSEIGDCTKKSYVAIAAAFGKGKTIENAVSDLELSYEPPRSAAYKANPRKYLLGYISSMINKKLLVEA